MNPPYFIFEQHRIQEVGETVTMPAPLLKIGEDSGQLGVPAGEEVLLLPTVTF